MNQICWWLADRFAAWLAPAAREAVLGDLVECGATGSDALRSVLGLALRRQLAVWAHPRAWLGLACLAAPFSVLLFAAAKRTADHTAPYVWLYGNNWSAAYVTNPAFRRDFLHDLALILLAYLALASWAWIAGFAMAWASRGAVYFNVALFSLTLLLGGMLGMPQYLERAAPTGLAADNDAVFAMAFYRVLFPLLIRAVFVIVPVICGVRSGIRAEGSRPRPRLLPWIAAAGALLALWRYPDSLVYSEQDGLWRLLGLQIVLFAPAIWLTAGSHLARRLRGVHL